MTFHLGRCLHMVSYLLCGLQYTRCDTITGKVHTDSFNNTITYARTLPSGYKHLNVCYVIHIIILYYATPISTTGVVPFRENVWIKVSNNSKQKKLGRRTPTSVQVDILRIILYITHTTQRVQQVTRVDDVRLCCFITAVCCQYIKGKVPCVYITLRVIKA